MNNYLTEAFKAFELLDEEVFPADSEGEEKLKRFIDGDKIDEVETIIDPDAETMDEIKESYIGDVILNCPVCQSKFYKKPEDVVIDEDTELANVEESCPYCQTPGGFEIVGEVAEFKGAKKEEEETDEEEVEVEESCTRKTLKEYKSLGGDLAEYQKWVDYDMKRYGKISAKTKRELDRAGLELVKDDHDDYEVIAKSREKLGEAFQYPVAKYLTAHIDELGEMTSPEDARARTLKALENGKEEASEKDKKQFEDAIDKIRAANKRAVLSMISTFLTQTKVNESFEEVEVKTDSENIKVEQEGEETKVSIRPREEALEDSDETIVPVSNELKAKIEDNQETDEDEEEIDIDEFDEESFDELEERYLKKVYENVKSYKTVKGTVNGNKIKLEGLITFNSGNKKKTQFVFESHLKTKNGKLKFLGENLNLSTNKKAFTLTSGLKDKKLIPESLTYNYSGKDAKTGKSQRLYGTIRK